MFIRFFLRYFLGLSYSPTFSLSLSSPGFCCEHLTLFPRKVTFSTPHHHPRVIIPPLCLKIIYCLTYILNYRPGLPSKSGVLPAFVNKVLLGHRQASVFAYYLWLFAHYCSVASEAPNLQHLFSLSFMRKLPATLSVCSHRVLCSHMPIPLAQCQIRTTRHFHLPVSLSRLWSSVGADTSRMRMWVQLRQVVKVLIRSTRISVLSWALSGIPDKSSGEYREVWARERL